MSADLIFRDATQADLPAIIAMLADDFLGARRAEIVGDTVAPEYMQAFAAIEADPRNHLIVAEHKGRIVGSFQLTMIPGLSYRGSWRALVEGVRIDGSLRGQGLGSQLIGHAVAMARKLGARTVQLTTNKARVDAQRFYHKLGFSNSHEGFKLDL